MGNILMGERVKGQGALRPTMRKEIFRAEGAHCKGFGWGVRGKAEGRKGIPGLRAGHKESMRVKTEGWNEPAHTGLVGHVEEVGFAHRRHVLRACHVLGIS